MSDHEPTLDERLNFHPILRSRVESLLKIVEDTSEKADEAELRVTEEVRRIGNDALQEWASGMEAFKTRELKKDNYNVTGHGKKKFIGTQLSEK